MAIVLGASLSCKPPEGDDQAETELADTGNDQVETKSAKNARRGVPVAGPALRRRKVLHNGEWVVVPEEPLIVATADGDLELIASILADDPYVSARAKEVSMNHALVHGDVELVKVLVAGGVDLPDLEYEREDAWGGTRSRLYDAMAENHYALATYLLDAGADPAAVVRAHHSYFMHCPLSLAIMQGQAEFARKLIERGAVDDPSMATFSLVSAAGTGDLEMVDLLISKGADLNTADEFHLTPIQTAVANGHQEVVYLLLLRGAEMDIFTAAALGMAEEVREYLAEDPSLATSKITESAPRLILWAALGDSAEIIALLAEAGADLNVGHIALGTALDVAASRGNTQTMQALLDRGANMEPVEFWDPTIIAAARAGQLEAAELLLANGADVNKATRWGDTALHAAAGAGHLEIVELLIARGADVNVATDQGDTPLSLARDGEFDDVVRLLLSHGADGPAGTRDP